MTLWRFSLILAAALLLAQADVALQKAIRKETVEGDLKGAIAMYEKLAHGGDRAIAAQALLRMGECHEKLGSAEARKAYERLLKEFGDSKEASQARARLATLGGGSARSSGLTIRKLPLKRDPMPWGGNVTSDGRYLGAVDFSTGNAAVIETETGKHWNVTDYGNWNEEKGFVDSAAISRDGKWIAYWHYRQFTPGGQLRVVDANGKNDRLLYQGKTDAANSEWGMPTDWSPDGKYIAIELTRGSRPEGVTEIAILQVGGGTPRVLKTAGHSSHLPRIMFSPDGRYLAYDFPPQKGIAETDVFVCSVDSGGETPIAPHAANDNVAGWAPDGSLLIASDRKDGQGLHRVPMKDGKQAGDPQLIRPGNFRSRGLFGMTKDGALYYSQHVGNMDAFVASMDFATGKLASGPERVTQRFPGFTSNPSWSADGRVFVYVHTGRGDRASTLVVHREGQSEERELLPQVRLAYFDQARVHPDGKSVLALAAKDGQSGLFRIDIQTGEATAVWQGQWTYKNIAWSPDGRYVFVPGGEEERSIVRHDTRTHEQKIIHTGDGRSMCFRPSPDGRQLAFIQRRAKPDQRDYLAVIPVEGGTATPIYYREPGEPLFHYSNTWLADGSHILIVKRGAPKPPNDEAWQVPANGGPARRTELLIKVGQMVQVTSHPDGKRLGYTTYSSQEEYWVMENFLPAAPQS